MTNFQETRLIGKQAMAHNRKLVLSGAALTTARNNRHGISVMAEIMDELEMKLSPLAI